MSTRARGNLGEEMARKFLIKKGFKILENQFFARVGEIDIVAARRGRLHFVEVKARSSSEFGYPEEALTRTKSERVRKAVGLYLLKNRIAHQNYQIDLITVELDWVTHRARVQYIENAVGEW
ncbi:YraN family protein [Candidatus Uhrbacteria bacterium]|nr:YraN family protein [Candidatus Uhrbacteria bacterium]